MCLTNKKWMAMHVCRQVRMGHMRYCEYVKYIRVIENKAYLSAFSVTKLSSNPLWSKKW